MKKQQLYRKFAKYYDEIYSKKDYQKETRFVEAILKKHKINGKTWLSFACGTGNHEKILSKKGFKITGVDLNKEMLSIARKKVPKAVFKQGNMRTASLKKKFDIVTCFFTAINYNTTVNHFVTALKNFKKHVKDGGVIIFDSAHNWTKKGARTHATFVDNNKTLSLYTFKFHKKIVEFIIYWIIQTKKEPIVEKDMHEIRPFDLKEIRYAAKQAGLKYKIYWDYSLTKKKGKRPIVVCYK